MKVDLVSIEGKRFFQYENGGLSESITLANATGDYIVNGSVTIDIVVPPYSKKPLLITIRAIRKGVVLSEQTLTPLNKYWKCNTQEDSIEDIREFFKIVQNVIDIAKQMKKICESQPVIIESFEI